MVIQTLLSQSLVLWGQHEKPQLESKNHTTKQSSLQNKNTESLPLEPYDYSLSNITLLSHDKNPPNVEFVHFLDSDDLLTLDCIEQCLECIGDCDVVWHETYCRFEDGISPKIFGVDGQPQSLESVLASKKIEVKTLSNLEFWGNREWFAGACYGLFRMGIFRKLRFCAGIMGEDFCFAILAFARARCIAQASFIGYIYRIRANSTSNYDLIAEDKPKRATPPYMREIANSFSNCTAFDVTFYHDSYSFAHVSLAILRFLKSLENGKLKARLEKFMIYHVERACRAAALQNDPKHLRKLLVPLEPYIKLAGKRARRSYYYPRFARFRARLRDLSKRPEALVREWRRRIFKRGDSRP